MNNVIPLGKYWVAIVMEDGSVLLQHLSSVFIGGTDLVVDLINPKSERDEDYVSQIEEDDPERIAIRTLFLKSDGAVFSDPDSISTVGILSDDVFEMITPSNVSAKKYFSKRNKKTNW